MNHVASKDLVAVGIGCVAIASVCLLAPTRTIRSQKWKTRVGMSLLGVGLVLAIASNMVAH